MVNHPETGDLGGVFDVVVLTSTKLACVYYADDGGATNYLRIQTITITGTVVSYDENAVTIDSNTSGFSSAPISLCKLTSTKAVVSWRDPDTGNLLVSEIGF